MRVLFVCTGNACRSPLAERLARLHYPQHHWESAGVLPGGAMHPLAAEVLAEHHADSDGFRPRDVYSLDLRGFSHVVLIGETARALFPVPGGAGERPEAAGGRRAESVRGKRPEVLYWDVDDPFETRGSLEEVLSAYRACAADLLKRIAVLVS